MKKLLLTLCIIVGGCGGGHKTFEQTMESLNKWREIAKEHNLNWSAEVESRGDNIGFYAKQSFGFDSGITVRLRVNGDVNQPQK